MLIIKGKISKLLYTKIKNFSLKKDKPTLHRKRRQNQDTEWEELSLVQKTDKKLNPEYTNINRKKDTDFPSGPVLKNPPTSAGDKGLIPGQGRSHMPWNN